MSNLGFRLAAALSSGGARGARPHTREAVLSALLAKRAAAHRAGLVGQERLLRDQILWALPMRGGERADTG